MQTVEEALVEFHSTYGLPVATAPVNFDSDNKSLHETWELRKELVREEYQEFMDAMAFRNLEEIADAICDLVYVAVGTAVSFGIPFDACFAEVQRSNMSKLGEDGKPIEREDGKILKGPNFSPPDLRKVIYG
jgi:predicted HAD superfamily Cof-like phosphohydrolase